MRKRDLRKLREEHNRERWRDLWMPAEVAQSDEAWLDAIAEHRSGTDEINRREYVRPTQDQRK